MTTVPSRPSRGGVHLAPALERGHEPLGVATTRSWAANVQLSGVRSTLNEALTSSNPRQSPPRMTPGDCARIVPSASTSRAFCQVLHTVPETTPESFSAPSCRASRPRWSRSTSRAATYAAPVHDGVRESPATSIANSIRPSSGSSNAPETRCRSLMCSRCNVTPVSGSPPIPRCSSIQRMRDANSEMLSWLSIHCARRSFSCGSAGESSPSSWTESAPSDRRTTVSDAPLAVISRGCRAPERSDSTGSIENVRLASRIEGSVPPPSVALPPESRTSLARNTGVQPRQ